MKRQVIVDTQNALAQVIRKKVRENEGEYDMVTSNLMQALASFEVAAQFAAFNDALAMLGRSTTLAQDEKGDARIPPNPVQTQEGAAAPQGGTVPEGKPTPAKPKWVRKVPPATQAAGAVEVGGKGKSTPEPNASSQETNGSAPQAASRGKIIRSFKRTPADVEAAGRVAPPVESFDLGIAGEEDNYPDEFDRAVSEGEEMDSLLARLGEQEGGY